MSDLPRWPRTPSSDQPYSRQALDKASRLRGATVTEGLCPYCAVGCGQLIYTKGGKLIDIEGNPESPINEGTLCPKGANAFQLAVNPHRVTQVLYRAPYSDHWETRTARLGARPASPERVKDGARRRLHRTRRPGRLLNSVRAHRHPRRGDDRQRGELPHQEAVRRRARRGLDREPGADMT